MGIYKIYAGLSGGFGGAHYTCTEEFDTRDCAESYAFESACEIYDSYEGLYGLRPVDDIISKYDVDEERALEIYQEERESWIDYYVKEVSSFEDNDDE